jgi:uncharacterized protein YecE (DUF72 family)
MKVHVGTSGWNYKHWKGVFYPEGLKSTDWLVFYARHFPTVELNVTFYRSIKASTFDGWYAASPPGFIFSAKMSRYITHIKRLKVDRESIERFSADVSHLKEKVGVILVQLPPTLKFDPIRLSGFFDLLDPRFRYTLEARNDSFLVDECFSLLKERNIAWCIADADGRHPYSESVTADLVYVRMHGRGGRPAGPDYRDDELQALAEKIRSWKKETWVYFNNDPGGFAVKNAKTLMEMLH